LKIKGAVVIQNNFTISLLAVSIILTSCAGAQKDLQVTQPPSTIQEERVLTLWTHEYSTFTSGLRDKWIPEFESSHPGVKVDYQTFPYSGSIVSFDTKLLAEVASGGGPDVWAMDSHNFTQVKYIEAGLLAPLDPKVFGYDSVDDIVNDYPPNSLNVFILDGKIYALFNELTTLCLFYNKNMFDRAGIPYLPEDKPVSWDQIGSISQQLLMIDEASGKSSQMGYQFGFFANYLAPEWYIQDFYPVMRQYGQDDLFVNGQPAGNGQAIIDALQFFYDFTYTYQAYDPYFVTDWFGDFSNDRVAMVTAGPWYPSAIRGINPDVRFGVAPHPVVDPDDPDTYQNIMYSFGWVVNANRSPEQQALAQEFLAFILGKKGEAEQPLWWFKHVGTIQPRKAFLEAPDYQEYLAHDPWMNCFIDTFDTYKVGYYQHSSDEAGAALVRAINRVVYDRMSPKNSAQLLQNELLLLP
jgi:ABC-type glycerol-3-phosphate transport system substrate-binding protein